MKTFKLILEFFMLSLCLFCVTPIAEAQSPDPSKIAEKLQDKNPQVQFRALWTLTYPDTKSIPRTQKATLTKLVTAKLTSPLTKIKYAAIRALAQLNPKTLPKLCPKLLQDKDPIIRAEILLALLSSQQHPKEITSALIPQLTDSSKPVRSAALRLAEKIPEQCEAFLPAVIDGALRYGATESRYRLFILSLNHRARSAMMNALKKAKPKDQTTLAIIAAGLPLIDVTPLLDPLKRGLQSESNSIKRSTIRALGILGQRARSFTPEIHELLKNARKPAEKVELIRTASKLSNNNNETAQILSTLLDAKSPNVIGEILTALRLLRQDSRPAIPKVAELAIRSSVRNDTAAILARTALKDLAPFGPEALPIILQAIDNGDRRRQIPLERLLPSFQGPEILDIYISQFEQLTGRGQELCLAAIAKDSPFKSTKLKTLLLSALNNNNPKIVVEALFLCARYPLIDAELKARIAQFEKNPSWKVEMALKLCESVWTNDPKPISEAIVTKISKKLPSQESLFIVEVIEEMIQSELYTKDLLEACKDNNDGHFRQAFCDIVEKLILRETWIAKQLIQLLNDNDPYVQRHALSALGAVGDEIACEPIIDFLVNKNDDREVETIGLTSLFLLGRPALRFVLKYILEHPPSDRMYILFLALRDLADYGLPSDKAILKGLDSPHETTRFHAIYSVYFEKNITPEIVDKLVEVLDTSSELIQNAIFYILAERKVWDERLFERAMKATESKSEKTRIDSARYITQSPVPARYNPALQQRLLILANDSSLKVRIYALFGQAKITKNWNPCLLEFAAILQHSRNADARIRVAFLLAPRTESHPKLEEALEHRCRNETNANVLGQIALALGRRQKKEVFLTLLKRRVNELLGQIRPALKDLKLVNSEDAIQLSKSENTLLRELYCDLFAAFEKPNPKARERLYERLSDPSKKVVVAALTAYSRVVPSAKALTKIQSLMTTRDGNVYAALLTAMLRAPAQAKIRDLFLNALQDSRLYVRAAAAQGLSQQIVNPEIKLFTKLVTTFNAEPSLRIRELLIPSLRKACPSIALLTPIIEKALRLPVNQSTTFLSEIRRLIRVGAKFDGLNQTLIPLLKSWKAVVRSHALMTLARLGPQDEKSLNAIRALEKDPEIDVRWTAKTVLAILNDDQAQALKLVREGLTSRHNLIRLRAVICFGMLRTIDETDIQRVAKLIDDSWWNVRYLAIEELGFRGKAAKSTIPVIEEKYWDLLFSTRIIARLSLKRIGEAR